MAFLEDFNYLTEKTQKLTQALYRVTDLFPEEEPLKWSLRKKAMEIFSKIVSLKQAGDYKKARSLEEILENSSEILNFLELASAGSFISQLNFGVLKREYLGLMDFLQDKKEEKPLLSKTEARGQIPDELSKMSDKMSDMSNRMSNRKPRNNKSREEQILSILEENNWLKISEIIRFFQGVSPKTIQRELSELVKIGKLQTQGTRRWRKYTLK